MKNNSYDKKILRLMRILNRLSNRGRVVTADLAEEFNVTVRTVQRDLELLSMTGFPLLLDEGTYKFEDGFSLRKINVTSEEKYLLMLFYKLFSQTDKPFNTTAKNLMDKVLVSDSKEALSDGISPQYKKEILKEEFADLSDRLAVRLEKCQYPVSFIKIIDAHIIELKEKIEALKSRDKVDMVAKFTKRYEHGEPIATIRVPDSYFKDSGITEFDRPIPGKEREFTIKTYLPGKFIPSFRISLYIDVFFNYFGLHYTAKDITCFDEFAEYLGFPRNLKVLDYEYSHGNRSEKRNSVLTRAGFFWDKHIPMPASEFKPFLNKKMGFTHSRKWDEQKKKWIIKR